MIIKLYRRKEEHSVILPSYLIKNMYEVAKPHLPFEFGGILTGVKGKDQDLIIDFEVPTKYQQTNTGFTRHPDNLNEYLKDIYIQSNARIEYIGEWHTHPNATPDFSFKDFKSIDEIAKDRNSKTFSPLLIILGMNKKSFRYNLYKYHDSELILFDKTLKI